MLDDHFRHRLLDEFQRDFPLTPQPYKVLGDRLGLSEDSVLESLEGLLLDQSISRVGAVIAPNVIGVSVLAALMVPEDQLESVAAWISGCVEVNHNYQREHSYNLWFVVAAPTNLALDTFFDRLLDNWPLPLLRLPLLREFHIDLGFPLSSSSD